MNKIAFRKELKGFKGETDIYNLRYRFNTLILEDYDYISCKGLIYYLWEQRKKEGVAVLLSYLILNKEDKISVHYLKEKLNLLSSEDTGDFLEKRLDIYHQELVKKLISE